MYLDFTNPIKRKEFDRQRKKQQMREMQNVSDINLKTPNLSHFTDHRFHPGAVRHQVDESYERGNAGIP